MPALVEIIEDGNTENKNAHTKTHEKLDEILSNMQSHTSAHVPLSYGGFNCNREYYNLFVIGGEKFENGSFYIAKNRSLVSAIEPTVKEQFFNIKDDYVIERILSLPSLFMDENADYMRSRPGQKAFLGSVINMDIHTDTIQVFFEIRQRIFQQSITDISHNLGILGNPGASELNNTHWTIKQVDLIDVLMSNGLLSL